MLVLDVMGRVTPDNNKTHIRIPFQLDEDCSNSPQMLGVSMQQVFRVFQEREQAAAMAFFSFLLCSVLGVFYIRSMAKEENAKL